MGPVFTLPTQHNNMMPITLNRQTLTALLVAGVFFMENLDATIITTALPVMAHDFHILPAQLSVGVSAYLVSLTVFIPISGWMADRFGARRIFPAAIAIFTLTSLLCSLSNGLWSFTVARILQGIGGAMMVPVGRLVVLRNTPRENIVNAIAILTWPALIAPILGPPLGGWISSYWGWRWIFLLNIPLGVIAFCASLALIRNDEQRVGRFDLTGFILSALAFALFMSGIELASRDDIPTGLWSSVLLSGLVLLALTGRHMKRAPAPLFDLTPLAIPTFRVTAVGGSLFRTAIGSAPFLLPLMFQVGFGWSPVASGVMLLWLFAGNLAMKPATTWIMQQFGFRRVLLGNGLLVSLGFVGCALLNQDTPHALVAVLMFFCGMTRSMHFTALNTLGFADVPQPQMRDATTLFSVMQQMNAGTGIAVGALVLSIAQYIHGTQAIGAHSDDFRLAFWMMTLIAALAMVDSLFLKSDAGHAVLVKKQPVKQ